MNEPACEPEGNPDPEGEPETDRLARGSSAIGFAVLFVGIARALALKFGFPGGAPGNGVVGWTSIHGYDKGVESGFFYYSLILAPIGMALGYWLAGKVLAKGLARTPSCAEREASGGGAWLILGAAASAMALFLALVSSTPAQTPARLVGLPAAALFLCVGAALVHRRAGARERSSLPRVVRRFRGAGSTVAAGVSLTVFSLAVGPKTTVPEILSEVLMHSLRISVVMAAAILIAFGVALLIPGTPTPTSPDGDGTQADRLISVRAAKAMRAFTWLLLARLAPENVPWVIASVGLALAAAAWSLFRSRPSGGAVTGSAVTDNSPTAPDHAARVQASARAGERRFFQLAFLPALVAALVFHHDVNGSLDFFHFGEWLTPGAEMLRGKMPFRDLYLQHGLIQNALRSFATFALFEPTFEFDRLSTNLMFGLTHGAFVVLGVFLFRSWITALVLALLLATPAGFPGESGLYLQPRFFGFLLALAFAFRDLRQARSECGAPTTRSARWPLIASGACAALATFWSLDSGVYAVMTITAFLFAEAFGREEPIVERARPFLHFGAGFAIGAAPFVLWLLSIDAFGAFVQNSREQVAYQMGVWGIPYPSFRETLSRLRPNSYGLSPAQAIASGRVIALVAVVVFVSIPSVLILRRLSGRKIPAIGYRALLLTLAGAALFRTALGRSDPNHLSYAGAILWPTLIVLGEHALLHRPRIPWLKIPWLKNEPAARALLRIAPLALVVGWLMTGWAPLYSMNKQWTRMSAVRPIRPGGIFVYCPLPSMKNVLIPREQAQILTSVAAILDERLAPGETFLDPSNIGALYFLTRRPVPSRYYYAVYAATPAMQERMIADLEASKPKVMIRCDKLGYEEFDGVPMVDRAPLLAAYLAKTYRLVADEGFAQVFERTSEVDP